jgi:hypothetical protein
MHVRTVIFRGIIALFFVVGTGGCTSSGGDAPERASPTSGESEHAELALHMSRLQRWTHKTALALQAQNPSLADFYLHEMEESIETIQTEAPTYEGHAIADLTEKMLVPSVEALDGALDDRDWDAVHERLQNVAQSCNQCHAATEHEFVTVDLEDVPNPYAQDFTTGTP